MIAHYLKVALRSLMKYKMQNLIAVLCVSLSLFCFSVCLYCSRYIFDTDSCFRNREQIVEVQLHTPDGGLVSGTPGKLASSLRKLMPEADCFCALTYPRERSYNVSLTAGKLLPYDLMMIETDSLYGRVFTPEVICGTWQQAVHTPNAIVLFESTAVRIFGSAEKAVGKQMTLLRRLWSSPDTTPREGGISYTVQAVMRDLPLNNSLNFLCKTDALVLNDSEGVIRNRRENVTGAHTFALPREGQSREQFMQKLNERQLTLRLFGEEMKVSAQAFGSRFWKDTVAKYFGTVTLIAGILILAAGMLNFFHFLVGSFFTRLREYNIRRVNGAAFGHLFAMLFVQSAFTVVLSFFVSFLMTELLAPYLRLTIVRYSIQIDTQQMMLQMAGYLLALLLVCALICLAVVLKISRTDVQAGLFGGMGRYGSHRIRNILLGVQLFIGWIFITLTVALYLQSEHVSNALLGTLSPDEKERVLSVPLQYGFLNTAQKKELIEEIRKYPDVEDILISEVDYLNGISGTGMLEEKDNRDSYLEMNLLSVEPNFFRFMHVDIEAGRTLQSAGEAVIDRKLAERLKKDMLGKTLYDYDGGYTVEGICTPFMMSAYNESIGFIFLPYDTSGYIGHFYVKCREGSCDRVTALVETVLRKHLPENVDCSVHTLADDIREVQALEFKLRGIVLFMAVIVLVISMLGIYSAITLDTEYRRKEMAIRKINGAGMCQIALLFARLYIVLLLSTSLLAFPLTGVLLHCFSRLYVSFIDTGVWFYGSIFLSVTLLILLTVYVRIRDIARINPAEVIKSE